MLVVDGNLLTREGVAQIMRKRHIRTATTDASPVAAAIAADDFRPDVALVNASTVDVAEMSRVLRCAIVAFGVPDEPDEVTGMVELQLAGFLLQSEPISRLFTLVDTARADDPQCPPAVVPMLMRMVAARPRDHGRAATLTARENEILALLRAGHANKEIARELGISARTVKNHLHNLYRKLQVHTRGEASAMARPPESFAR